MIRRSITLQDGRPGWLLIPQRAHARLAEELARAWTGLPDFCPLDATEDLLAAIAHHDDGWDLWDDRWYEHTRSTDEGLVPIAFHEMQPADSNQIWDRSIELAQTHGPGVTYIVARHFIRMRGRSSSVDPSGSSESFIDRNQRRCERSLLLWKEVSERTPAEMELVERAVDALQFFDNLSLILCLGKVESPIELTPPTPPALVFECNHTAPHDRQPARIRFRPNPIEKPATSFRVEALEVPRGRDAKSLKRHAVTRQLSWTLADSLL